MTENGCHMHMLCQPFLNMGIISLQAAAAFTDCAAEVLRGIRPIRPVVEKPDNESESDKIIVWKL